MKKGWQTKRFAEILEIRNGKNQRYVLSDSGTYPIYGSAGNVMGMATDFICEAGTTIIGRKGNINSPVFTDTPFWNVDTAFGLSALNELDSKFLFYFCLTYDFGALNRGTTIPSLVKSELLEIEIPIPPLPEQRRIVGILDEAFAGIATARAHAEQNRQNARALFESHLHTTFTQRGKGWVEKPLGKCFRLKSGDGLTSKAMKAGAYPVFGGNGIAGMHDEFNLAGDNVIIGRVGALCGNARHIIEKIWLTDNAFRIVDFCCEFDGAFLTYLLNYKNLRGLARQAAQPVISNSSLKDLVLNFPGVTEQRRITKQLDALQAETRRLEALYTRKLAALDELKAALLHQAFSGML